MNYSHGYMRIEPARNGMGFYVACTARDEGGEFTDEVGFCQTEGNAKLLACAGQMYEALQQIERLGGAAADIARAVINKVEAA